MKNQPAGILFLFFLVFLSCSFLPLSISPEALGADLALEKSTSAPEEQKDESSQAKDQEFFNNATALLPQGFQKVAAISFFHFSMPVENIYFEVPHSPPDLA